MLIVSNNLAKKIEKLRKTDTVLILDFDDGVGPFSNVATCTLDVAFNLILAKKSQLTDDFDETLVSNLGKIYVKKYALPQLGNGELKLTQNKYLANVLSSDAGVVDSNCGIYDVQGVNENEEKVGSYLSCDGVSQV